MKVCGIIAECDPLHNGHQYLIEQARTLCAADYVLILLSGDHVQRGEPALVDKYCRTHMLLRAGADLVLELPVPFATGSAQYFARGAIAALSHTGVVTDLLFGSESGTLPAPADAPHATRRTAPAARRSPNDLLAAAYIEALDHFQIHMITAHTLPRRGAAHDADTPTEGFASASYLRRALLESDKREAAIASFVPAFVPPLLRDYRARARYLALRDYDELLFYALLRGRDDGYSAYFDVYDDLSDKLRRALDSADDLPDLLRRLKTRDISYSHLSRALLHILLDIRKDAVDTLISAYGSCPWLRPLGFRRSAAPLLHAIKANSDRPFLSKLADARSLLSPDACALLRRDLFASELYARTAALPQDTRSVCLSEYRHPLIVLP